MDHLVFSNVFSFLIIVDVTLLGSIFSYNKCTTFVKKVSHSSIVIAVSYDIFVVLVNWLMIFNSLVFFWLIFLIIPVSFSLL